MTSSKPPEKLVSRSNPTTPGRKVTLKLKFMDHDLDNGKYRQTTPARSKSTTRSKQKSTPVPRTKRGRPRTSKRWQPVTEAELFGSDEEEEQEEAEAATDRGPTLSDFYPMSLLGFPTLLPPSHSTRTLSPQMKLYTPAAKSAKRCACCGVPAPPNVEATGRLPPKMNSMVPPWTLLNLRPVKHVNVETNSVTDLVVTRSGPCPNTLEFWYDLTFAEMARKSEDLDLKMLCLNLIRWRVENDDSCAVREFVATAATRNCEVEDERVREKVDLEMGVGVRRVKWDEVLAEAVVKGKLWRKARRLQEKESAKAAGWAVWERRMRSRSRGGFVVDENGAWILRMPGENGRIRRALKLGYKRSLRKHERKAETTGDVDDSQTNVQVPKEDISQVTEKVIPGTILNDHHGIVAMDVDETAPESHINAMELGID